jgi:hypothetical protein
MVTVVVLKEVNTGESFSPPRFMIPKSNIPGVADVGL